MYHHDACRLRFNTRHEDHDQRDDSDSGAVDSDRVCLSLKDGIR